MSPSLQGRAATRRGRQISEFEHPFFFFFLPSESEVFPPPFASLALKNDDEKLSITPEPHQSTSLDHGHVFWVASTVYLGDVADHFSLPP